mgnify:CR=1 FL=1
MDQQATYDDVRLGDMVTGNGTWEVLWKEDGLICLRFYRTDKGQYGGIMRFSAGNFDQFNFRKVQQ